MLLGRPVHTHSTGWGKAGEATAAPVAGSPMCHFLSAADRGPESRRMYSAYLIKWRKTRQNNSRSKMMYYLYPGASERPESPWGTRTLVYRTFHCHTCQP